MLIQGKTVWITGASSGIGEALAKELAILGATLILSARSADKLEQLRSVLPHPERHRIVPLDLASCDSIRAAVTPVLEQGISVDILVNNGGISQRGLARNTCIEVQREVMEVNYFGIICLTQLLLPAIVQNKGMVVTVASVAGKVGGQSMAGYAASKHAIIGYMDCLRAEESQNGLKVLTICPGFVQTQISVNARTDDGQPYGRMAGSIAGGITAHDCACGICNAIEKDKREVVIGKGLSALAPTIKRIWPGLLMTIAARKNIR